MLDLYTAYIAVGGNRHPAAADWDRRSGLLAYGADKNVALWSPLDNAHRGVRYLLRGHTDRVNAVRFLPTEIGSPCILFTGSADKTIIVWRIPLSTLSAPELVRIVRGHDNTVNCLAVQQACNVLLSGAADGTVKVWRCSSEHNEVRLEALQTLVLTPKFYPLALALHHVGSSSSLMLAVAGTRSTIQIYAYSKSTDFILQASLGGHEGWIRSLAFTLESTEADSDVLLASASQDKYIRLWRIAKEATAIEATPENDDLGTLNLSLSNKTHKIETSRDRYSLTFEALLLGHDDWIYSVSWSLGQHGPPQLLSASEDNSLAMWNRDEDSGIWLPTIRLGEISAQKGSTTATGSAGGFWHGLWGPTCHHLVSLGRTGSWRIWSLDVAKDRWVQGIGVSGHTNSVGSIAWSKSGSYLLSTSTDQTTRLHAEWCDESRRSWHEMSRPQIHGYDLNCIDTINERQFISGADEKLLRVFDKPRATARLLERLCDIHGEDEDGLPEIADMPVLGLSNKALEIYGDNEGHEHAATDVDERQDAKIDISDARRRPIPAEDNPPHEDLLARHTLWPEREKLYGHGYEISAVAATHDGSIVATSCKASSLTHAVIRLYTTRDWRQVEPPLAAHSLTVTSLQFSVDDRFLLSVGRDRQWVVWKRDSFEPWNFTMHSCDLKGHTRMILSASWAPAPAQEIFATAGRDKYAKVWLIGAVSTDCIASVSEGTAITAVNIAPYFINDRLLLALGTETGRVVLHAVDTSDMTLTYISELDGHLQPAGPISQLAFRPPRRTKQDRQPEDSMILALASEDSSLRLVSIFERL